MSGNIKLNSVSKVYWFNEKPSEKIMALIGLKRKKTKKYHVALNGVTLNVKSGESLGLVGLNGSGKSTLANIISQSTSESYGTVNVKGKVNSLAVNSGLNPSLTGIQNIELKGIMMGMTTKEIKKIIPKVIEFSEIGDFVYKPLKTYSSGMKSRLGFGIAVNIRPDILIVDEALSVGDASFTNKCLKKMREFQKLGTTLIFVSHSMSQIKDFCDRGIWVHFGEVKAQGPIKEVVSEYVKFLNYYKELSVEERAKYRDDHQITIENVVKKPTFSSRVEQRIFLESEKGR